MQDLIAERDFYDSLFGADPQNEHIAGGYDDLHALAFAEGPPAGIVLDLGCGTGAHAVRFAKQGYEVVAIDVSREGVRAARARFAREQANGRFVVADISALPFRDGAADTAWAALVLHHFPGWGSMPEEVARVTRRRLVAFEPNARNFLTGLAFNVIHPVVGLSSTPKNQRALLPGGFIRRFGKAAFDLKALHYIHRPWSDGSGPKAVVRRIFNRAMSLLPLSFRANKFLVVLSRRDR